MELQQYLQLIKLFKKCIFHVKYHENSLPIFNVISVLVITLCIKLLLKCSLCWKFFCFLGHSRKTIQIKSGYYYDSSIWQAFYWALNMCWSLQQRPRILVFHHLISPASLHPLASTLPSTTRFILVIYFNVPFQDLKPNLNPKIIGSVAKKFFPEEWII